MSLRPRGEHGRRRAHTAPPVDDVLGLIDATTDSLCACGCRTPLRPDGPSAWFATQECQFRFQAKDATRPEEVWNAHDPGPMHTDARRRRPMMTPEYDRPEPALVDRELPRHDLARVVAIAEQMHERNFGCHIRAVRRPADLLAALPRQSPQVDAESLARAGWERCRWQRLCPTCRTHHWQEDRLICSTNPAEVRFGQEPEYQMSYRQHFANVCGHCGFVWPGPYMTAFMNQHDSNGAVYGVMLAAADMMQAGAVSASMVHYPHVWEMVWSDLERDLVDALYYRDDCQAQGCARKFREVFNIPFLNNPTVKLCPEHAIVLWRSPATSMELT